MNWLRLYNGVLDDPKVQRLAPELFKTWVNLLCLAGKLGGKLPPVDEIAFALRVSLDDAESHCRSLVSLDLLDRRGNGFVPHNWEHRQFSSDSSAERMRRHRKRHTNGNGDTPKTPPRMNGDGLVTADVTSHVTEAARKGDGPVTAGVTPPRRLSDALDQIRTDQNRSEQIINAGAGGAAGDDDDDSIFGLFKRLTGRNTTPKDREVAWYLDGKGVTREDCERGIRLAIERAPGGRVNSLAYCVPVIEELAKARRQEGVFVAFNPDVHVVGLEPGEPLSTGAVIVAIDDPDGESGDDVGAHGHVRRRKYSESEKAPVFAAAAQFVRQYAALGGEQPSRDELRSHLVEWCLGRGIDIGIVDAIYPAVVATAAK